MNKQQMIEFVQSLPDDLEVMPVDIYEIKETQHEWESQMRSTSLGGVYQCNVDNELTLRLRFRTRYQGEFMRKYSEPEGVFHNLHRIDQRGIKS